MNTPFIFGQMHKKCSPTQMFMERGKEEKNAHGHLPFFLPGSGFLLLLSP
jgi:hypothetical protein